jgi:hypothetical protein
MGVRRFTLAAAPAAGVALGALAWLLFGGAPKAMAELGSDGERLAAASAGLKSGAASSDDALFAEAASRPPFALTTGPGAMADVVVTLEGLARSSHGASALLSINGAPSTWIDVGRAQGGVTLEEVQPTRVVLLTPLGRKEVALGEAPASGAPPSDPSGAGPRAPTPPASAPATP